MKAYTVAVGIIDPRKRACRRAVKYIAKLDGILGVHPDPLGRGTLLLFESENAAKIARNLMTAKGIQCGYNICECEIDDQYAKREEDK